MLSYIALAALGFAIAPQSPKHHKKTTAAATSASTTGSTSADPNKEPRALREAPCVLALKGSLVRKVTIPRSSEAALTSQIYERFDYEIPGTLEERMDPTGAVRFQFKPTAPVQEGSRAALHLEENTSGDGGIPVVVDGKELVSFEPLVFEAAARGQGIVPVAGHLNLRGRLKGQPTPAGIPVNGEAPLRPVVSNPLPPLSTSLVKNGASTMRFEGISLWAWPNSKGPFIVVATVDYRGRTSIGTVTGTVEATFRIGATKQTAITK